METVELHPAWWWLCDACGNDVFHRAVVTTIPVEDLPDHLRAMVDDDMVAGFTGHSCPSVVTCPHCGSTYKAEDSGRDFADDAAGEVGEG
jgi:hypothetical protein